MAHNRQQTDLVRANTTKSIAARTSEPVRDEQVAQRAYEKWCARGCPTGDDLHDWFEAQAELCKPCEPVAVAGERN